MPRDDLMIHGDLPVVDLDRLMRPIVRIKIFGSVHDVLPVDGRAADLLHQVADARRQAELGDANAMHAGLLFYDVARQIVAAVVPTLTAEQRQRLTIEQLTQIIGLATRQVEEVEAAIERVEGNGHEPGDETQTPGSPVRTSASPSGRSSSASRATPAVPSSKSRTTRTH
jgi:hypothetical protein